MTGYSIANICLHLESQPTAAPGLMGASQLHLPTQQLNHTSTGFRYSHLKTCTSSPNKLCDGAWLLDILRPAATQLALGPEYGVNVGSGQLAVLRSRANLAQGQCCRLQSFMWCHTPALEMLGAGLGDFAPFHMAQHRHCPSVPQ